MSAQMDMLSSDKDEPNIGERRSFLGKLGALLVGAAVAPSLLAASGSVDKPKDNLAAALERTKDYADNITRDTIPLPDGFEVMELPSALVNWKGEEIAICSKTQKLRTQMQYNYDNPADRGPHLVDYDQLKAELTELGYTHLYMIMWTPVMYNIDNFEPYIHLMVRGCCLK